MAAGTERNEDREVRHELDIIVAGLLRPVCWALAALYSFLAITPFFVPQNSAFAGQSPVWAASALVFLAAASLQRTRPVPARWANLALGATAAVVLVNATRLLVLGGPSFTPALLMVMIGYATLALSIPFILLLCTACIAAWAMVAQAAPDEIVWAPMGILLVSGASIAVLTGTMRLNATRRLVRLRLHERSAGEERQRRAEERLRAQLINTAAHEIATPLTPIMIELYNLRGSSGLSEDQKRALQVIENNFRRLNLVIQNIKEYARPLASTAVTRTLTDMSHLVEDVVEAIRPSAERLGLVFTSELATGVQAQLDVDGFRLALSQVIDNALKFTPRGGLVRVRLERQGGDALVHVEDTGPGIAPERLPHIFEPLPAGAPQETRRGAHLGLHVARRILEAHDGSLVVESEFGHGTQVHLRVPTPQTN